MPAAQDGIWRDPKHGTVTGYKNYGCRCSPCRAANARQAQRFRQNNPEHVKKYRKQYRATYDPDKLWKGNLRKYNLTPESYEILLQGQGGGCAICRKTPEENGQRLAIDHDHDCCPKQGSCGQCIRGLLCSNCNHAVGQLHDSPELADATAVYLRRFDQIKSLAAAFQCGGLNSPLMLGM